MVNTKEIKKRMVDFDLTFAELADRIKMTPTYTSAVLNNKKPLTLNFANKVQEALQISDDDFGHYFLSGEEESA